VIPSSSHTTVIITPSSQPVDNSHGGPGPVIPSSSHTTVIVTPSTPDHSGHSLPNNSPVVVVNQPGRGRSALKGSKAHRIRIMPNSAFSSHHLKPLRVVVWPLSTPACPWFSCSACTSQNGCVWCGNTCSWSPFACGGLGCASTPLQCPGVTNFVTPQGWCGFLGCQGCTATPGCMWSNSQCALVSTECVPPFCVNTLAQCSACLNDFQCRFDERCVGGQCTANPCSGHSHCGSCLRDSECFWDSSRLRCVLIQECEYTCVGASTPVVCVQTPSLCESFPVVNPVHVVTVPVITQVPVIVSAVPVVETTTVVVRDHRDGH